MAGESASLYFNFLKGRDTATPHMATTAAKAKAMGASMANSASLAGLGMSALVSIIAGGVAELVAFTDALAPMVGYLAALPAAAFAGVAGIAALIVGFSGLGAALKHTSGGAGQSAASIAAAEHRIEMAQRSAAQAQEDLNDARATAAQRLMDLTREMARAHLDEEAAVLAVADAERQVRAVRRRGDPLVRQQADLSLREAVQSLEEIRARNADLAEEQARRNAQGVEGSDEVQSALQRQADAMYEVQQAQAALTSGGGGGSDAAAEAYAKLTNEGKALVDTLRGLGPAWTSVRMATQSALLQGLGDDVQAVADQWLPMLLRRLPEVAKGWNNAFRGTAQLATTNDFLNDMDYSLGQTATMWQRVGSSFAPFLSGFRHFIVVGSDFLPRLGDWVLRIANKFDVWAKNARDTGKAHNWIEKAVKTGHEFWLLLGALGAATVALFKTGDGGDDFLPRVTAAVEKFTTWINSDGGQSQMTSFWAGLREIWVAAGPAIGAILDALTKADLSGVVSTFTVFGAAMGVLASHMDTVNKILPILLPAMAAYRVATLAAAAGQWVWNVAMAANPIGAFIVAIVAMGLEIWYMVEHFDEAMTTLRRLWDFNWNANVQIVRGAIGWITGAWNAFVDWLSGLGPRVGASTWGMWGGIVEGFRNAINSVIYLWNRLAFTVPEFKVFGQTLWGGGTIGTPDIPFMDTGGRVTGTGLAVVHEGEEVVTAAQVRRGGGGGGQVVISFAATGDPLLDAIVKELRKFIRIDSGGDVQVSLGR